LGDTVVNQRQILNWLERGHRFADLVIALGWPPPGHMPTGLADAITTGHSLGVVTPEQVSELFVGFYDQNRIERLLAHWGSYEWLRHRSEILRQGIESHNERRYFASVCTLLPQIEGTLGEELKRAPNPQNDAGSLFDETHLSKAARVFYVRLARGSFSWSPEEEVPDLSRNAILHGRDTAYGTRQHSLKVILMLDAVLAIIQERRSGQRQQVVLD
jgi:hypothetical protein